MGILKVGFDLIRQYDKIIFGLCLLHIGVITAAGYS